ncbi:MAG: trypsin-like peptidase domain-containing protein [Akkermansiaceae bacterium]
MQILSPHPPMLSAIKRFFALLLVFIVFFFLVTAVRTWRANGDFSALIPSFFKKSDTNRPEDFTPSTKPALDLSDVQIISRLNQEYAKLTNAVVPSVVSIDTSGFRTERLMDFRGRSRVVRDYRYPTKGLGSGVIVSEEGHIITNHHVISGQQQIRITMHDGKTYGATMIGEDDMLDIAVIKIDSKRKFKPLMLGDSSLSKVGQLVFAVGNPYGLGETVTQGIISAKERSLSDRQRNLIQTDAAINPGNSGGPLVNLTGEIIGINSAIISTNKENPGFQGAGFSIPSNDVKEALNEILKNGRVVRGFLGVQMADLNLVVRTTIGYQDSEGSAVGIVEPGSPAEKAGLMPMDVILKYNGEVITLTNQLIDLVQKTQIGAKIPIQVWRKGQILNLEATITQNTPSRAPDEAEPENVTHNNEEILRGVGVKVQNISGSEGANNSLWVVVQQVLPSGTAHSVLQPGDLIIELNNSPISNSEEFYLHLAASAAVQPTSLQILRKSKPLRVSIPQPFGNQ